MKYRNGDIEHCGKEIHFGTHSEYLVTVINIDVYEQYAKYDSMNRKRRKAIRPVLCGL